VIASKSIAFIADVYLKRAVRYGDCSLGAIYPSFSGSKPRWTRGPGCDEFMRRRRERRKGEEEESGKG